MPDIQDVFNRLQTKKKEKKKLKSTFRDALLNSKPYQDMVEDLRRLKEKKQGLEDAIKADFQSELSELERLDLDLKGDVELLNDLALTRIMKGETLEITDENDTKYEPVLSVKFKKQG